MNTGTSAALQILVVAAVLALIIGRRFTPRPVRGDARRWRLPLIVSAYGAYTLAQLGQGAHPVSWNVADAAYLAVGVVLSVAFGLARGFSLRIYDEGGTLMQRYRLTTAVLWAAMIAVRLIMDLSAHAFGVATAVAGSSIALMFGVSLLSEAAAVTLRVAAEPAGPAGSAGPWDAPGRGMR